MEKKNGNLSMQTFPSIEKVFNIKNFMISPKVPNSNVTIHFFSYAFLKERAIETLFCLSKRSNGFCFKNFE
jgi:hypothetical protein